jgi:predicted Zn-dependent protease
MPTFLRALAVFSVILCLGPIAAWPETSSREENWEIQVGRQRYMDYQERGEIVSPQSPLYRTLDPIGNAIAAVADRQYFAPFHFILLNEQTPNAFSMPGGNIYVTTALLSFLKNKDELAGVICHEVNHDIHHDMYEVYQATQGRSPQDPSVIAYERAAERNADRAGAFTCAKAGFNPWGMVWNFRQYRQAMGVSNNGGVDHPSDEQREADLIALFRSQRATFGKFSDDIASATPLARSRQVAQTQYSPASRYPSNSQYYQQYHQYPQQQYHQYPQQQYQQYPQQQYQQYPQQQYQQYPQQQYQQYPQQQYQQYPQQQYQQYPQQQYQQYPQQQYQQYPQHQYQQYPQQQYQQYPQQQRGPYPPPPLPACYPGC